MTNMVSNELRKLAGTRKYLFFGGKGGVGKTTMASSTAVWLADQGYNTLLVATDPTVSLSEAFRQRIDEIEPTKIEGMENLHGLNIDPKKAPGVFQRRLEGMTKEIPSAFGNDTFSTPCAEEMAAFDQFVSYLQNDQYERIVFDTAPTGHTLRELSMPFDWSSYMADQIQNRKELAASLGWDGTNEALAVLRREKERYDRAVITLSDGKTSAFTLVLLPEKLPVEETARAIKDLAVFGIKVPSLIVNEVIPSGSIEGNPFLSKRRINQEKYITEIEGRFKDQIYQQVPLLEADICGLETLRQVASHLYGDD
jgi:arsenite/tail-anchored protein-transporting ATPase